MARQRVDVVVRFFRKRIEVPGGCWEWLGSKTRRDGYGQLWVDNHMVKAHRFSYAQFVGEITDGLCVCHKCDNPGCVNPEHLFLGTNADNVRDKVSKNRQSRLPGSLDGMAKLSGEDVHNMRKSGLGPSALSRLYPVSKSACSYILRNETWKV